jgi:hypothetical protein
MWPFTRNKKNPDPLADAADILSATPPSEFKYIGHVKCTLHMVDDKSKTIPFKLLLWMTADGQRRFSVPIADGSVMRLAESLRWEEFNACTEWGAGGPFPEGFVPETDVLGEMLSKLVDSKLVGDPK